MADCANAEMRDLLPDVANGRLSGVALATVEAHIAACADCRAELALISGARAVILANTPAVDTGRILAAIATIPARRARSQWADWRIAATIAVVALGGAGVYTFGGLGSRNATDSLTATIEHVAQTTKQPAESARGSATVPSRDAELSVAGDLGGLTDDQLRTLLDKIGQTEALPAAEGRRVSIPIGGVTPDGDDFSDSTGAM